MTAQKAVASVMNIAFAILIWFAIPLILPTAAVLGWLLIFMNALFSVGIAIGIAQAYATPQE
jgi:hypothetical protein